MNGFWCNCCVSVLLICTMAHVITSNVIHTNTERYNKFRSHGEFDISKKSSEDHVHKEEAGIPKDRDGYPDKDSEKLVSNDTVWRLRDGNSIRKRAVSPPSTLSSTIDSSDGWTSYACPVTIHLSVTILDVGYERMKKSHKEGDWYLHNATRSHNAQLQTITCISTDSRNEEDSVFEDARMECSQDYTTMIFYPLHPDGTSTKGVTMNIPTGCTGKRRKY